MITHLCHVPIFSRAVFMVGNCSSIEADAAVFRLKKKNTKVTFTPSALGCVVIKDGDVYAWVKDLEKGSIMLHELTHCAASVMECCGIPLNHDTEEVLCYLVGYLKLHLMDPMYEKWNKSKAALGNAAKGDGK